jgi:hypothetical protein
MWCNTTDTLQFRMFLMLLNTLSACLFYFYEVDLKTISQDVRSEADALRSALSNQTQVLLEVDVAETAVDEETEEDQTTSVSVLMAVVAGLCMLALCCKSRGGHHGATAGW